MTIVKTGKFLDTGVVDICETILRTANDLRNFGGGYCASNLRVGEHILNSLRLSNQVLPIQMFTDPVEDDGSVGVFNGTLRVYLDKDMDPVSCVVSHKDTGIVISG